MYIHIYIYIRIYCTVYIVHWLVSRDPIWRLSTALEETLAEALLHIPSLAYTLRPCQWHWPGPKAITIICFRSSSLLRFTINQGQFLAQGFAHSSNFWSLGQHQWITKWEDSDDHPYDFAVFHRFAGMIILPLGESSQVQIVHCFIFT